MGHMTLLRLLCGFLGVLALYSSVCLYESEEGRVQTRLEGLWLRLTDRRTSFVSRHYNTVQNLAWVASRALDRIFGKRAISWQFMAASLLLSFASLHLGMWLARPRLGWDSFIWGSAFALVAIAPLFSRRLAVVPTLASAALLINLLFALAGPGLSLVRGRPIERPLNPNFLLMWGLAIPLCLASSVAVLGALRRLLRSAAEEESLWRAAAKLVGLNPSADPLAAVGQTVGLALGTARYCRDYSALLEQRSTQAVPSCDERCRAGASPARHHNPRVVGSSPTAATYPRLAVSAQRCYINPARL